MMLKDWSGGEKGGGGNEEIERERERDERDMQKR